MKTILSTIITIQLVLSPCLAVATPDQSSAEQTHVAPGNNPLMFTDRQSFPLPNGEVYTSENTIVVAETAEQKAIAEKWYLGQMEIASSRQITYRVVGITTAGDLEQAAANQLVAKFPANTKANTETIKKPLLERIKNALTRAKASVEKPLAKWVEKHPDQFKIVFAIARGGMNGAFSSFVFNHYYLDGAIPTWLAWTAGLTLGTISGTINYISDAYSHWMDREADAKTQNIVLKLFPFLNKDKVNELKSLSKWAFLEAIFLAIPISLFEYLPQLITGTEGYSFASSWMAGLFAVSMSFATGMFAQYPWEKGISRAHTSDTTHAPDHLAENWIKFRTALMFVIISALQVTVTSLSLGDFKISSYVALGAMGVAGLYYRKKVFERTNKEKAEKVLNSSAKSCRDHLSYILPNKTPYPLSWVG